MNDNYFIINSNNYKEQSSRLFGYKIDNNRILYDVDSLSDGTFSQNEFGCYVDISVSENEIIISQDYSGSYGIFVYGKNGFFAISNSLLLLTEHVKDKVSLNKDVFCGMLAVDLSNLAYRQTIVNEIICLARDEYLVIDMKDGHIEIRRFQHEESLYGIESSEAMELLDNWYEKWISIIRKLYEENLPIDVDLTGGIDSRIVFSMFLNASIDLKNINVISYSDKAWTHAQDFSIATEIAKKYDFKLNSEKREFKPYSLNEVIQTALYSYVGVSKQYIFNSGKYFDKRYRFTGASGEKIRGYWKYSADEFMSLEKRKLFDVYGNDIPGMDEALNRLYKDSFDYLARKYLLDVKECGNIGTYLWNDIGDGRHFGKLAENIYNCGEIRLQPLSDPMLSKIKLIEDRDFKDLIAAIIYERYLPEILNFPFDSNHSISEEARKSAQVINQKYPYRPRDLAFLNTYNRKTGINADNSRIYGSKDANEFMKKSYFANQVRDTISEKLGKEIYYDTGCDLYQRIWFPLGNAEVVMFASYILDSSFTGTYFDYLKGNNIEDAWVPYDFVEKVQSVKTRLMDTKNRDDQIMRVYSNWIKNPDAIKNYILSHSVKKLGIYGIGRLGIDLADFIHSYIPDCRISFTMDRAEGKHIVGITSIGLDDSIPDCDVIITTVAGMESEIESFLKQRTSIPIVALNDIVSRN